MHITALVNKTEVFNAMDGNDGVEHIMRTSPMGKNKAVEKFSKDFSTASIYLFNRNTCI